MRRKVDAYILWPAVILIVTGFLMILSVTPVAGLHNYNDEFYFILRQLFYLAAGLVLCAVLSFWDYTKLQKYTPFALAATFFLLLLTYWPGFGVTAGGASRWLRLGLLSFQPSELVKFFLIVYIANALVHKKETLADFWRGALPILLVCGALVFGILKQPDLGTGLVIGATALLMLIVGGSNLMDLFVLSLLAVRVLIFQVSRTPYQLRRWTAFLNPLQDRQGAGWNTVQSLIAVGSGSWFGVGLGGSRQKFAYLPQHYNDYIFAMICEERGFLLAAVIVFLFALLVLRGIRLAGRVRNPFGAYLALGFSLCLGIQTAVHMLVVLGWAPAKGITLPFISYGGSSLIISLAMLGVLLRISREAE
ncbi:MAG: putative lipid II flippase FtsW [Candidatus Margulisbacteria bacterium]|jgi:cell division protein FtsW|nr:putative lipid II flippase FtsW [Candidatus Margulisiibacteriota bacterium]